MFGLGNLDVGALMSPKILRKVAKNQLPGILQRINKILTDKYGSQLKPGEAYVSTEIVTRPDTTIIVYRAVSENCVHSRYLDHKPLLELINEADADQVEAIFKGDDKK